MPSLLTKHSTCGLQKHSNYIFMTTKSCSITDKMINFEENKSPRREAKKVNKNKGITHLKDK